MKREGSEAAAHIRSNSVLPTTNNIESESVLSEQLINNGIKCAICSNDRGYLYLPAVVMLTNFHDIVDFERRQ